MAARVPITIRRRNTTPAVVWVFEDCMGMAIDLAPFAFDLLIRWETLHQMHAVTRTSAPGGGLIKLPQPGGLAWEWTLAEAEVLPIAPPARYEVICKVGSEVVDAMTWADGPVLVEGVFEHA